MALLEVKNVFKSYEREILHDLNLKNKHPRRIYYLFLVIIFFLASTEIAYSQVKNLSLHLTNVTLEEALAQIKQKGEYSLWYRNEEKSIP